MSERLFLLQNGLYDQHTHYFSETAAYREAAQGLGLTLVGYANRRIPEPMAKLLGVKPVFDFPPGQLLSRDRHCAALADYLDLSAAFAAGCRTLVADACGAGDHVLVPYALPAEVLGLARWLAGRPPGERPRVMLVFHLPDLRWVPLDDRSGVRGDFSFWRHAFVELAKVVPAERLFIGATVRQLAGVIARIAEHPVSEVPICTWWLADGIAEARRQERGDPERGADLIVCGDFRAEKGRELVPEVLARVLAARPALRVRLQVGSAAAADEIAGLIRRGRDAAAPVRLDIRAGQLSQEEFVRRLASSRLVLLPYVPQRYALRGSAVFAEAAGYGVPAVVPQNTWLHDCLLAGRGAGVSFGNCTADEVSAAVLAALDDIDALEARAVQGAAAWRAAGNAEVLLRIAGFGAAPEGGGPNIAPKPQV